MRYITREGTSRFQYRATGLERLEALVAFLDALPADRLTLRFWFSDGRGCAVGLAATDPWFQAQGLRLENIEQLARCHPVYLGRSDWEAIAAFFELSTEQCRSFFAAEAYPCSAQSLPQIMAERIRRHLVDVTSRRSFMGNDVSAPAIV
jgi:hypothetical protein